MPPRHPRFALIILLAILAGATTVSFGQQAEAIPEAAADDEADHEALREIRKVAEEGINNNQLELLKPYLADGFTIVTYTDSEFSDFDVFKERWQQTREKLLAGGSYTTDLKPERSVILGDIAIARGNSQNVLTTGSGDTFEYHAHWTAVLQKQDGQWKILRVHSSLSPFDNPMMIAAVKQRLIYVGAISGVAGLIVGMLATWIFSRSRRCKPDR